MWREDFGALPAYNVVASAQKPTWDLVTMRTGHSRAHVEVFRKLTPSRKVLFEAALAPLGRRVSRVPGSVDVVKEMRHVHDVFRVVVVRLAFNFANGGVECRSCFS